MDKKIVVKEIDKLKSSLHKDRIVTEYLIYLMLGDNTQPLEAYTEFGELNKIFAHHQNDILAIFG